MLETEIINKHVNETTETRQPEGIHQTSPMIRKNYFQMESFRIKTAQKRTAK